MVTILRELTELKISGVSRMFLLCRCDVCGSEFSTRKDHVLRSKQPIKSCGCLIRQKTGRIAYNAKPEGMAAAKNVYNSYRGKCIKHKILFEISFDDFIILTKQNCFYCGSEPNQMYSGTFKNGIRAGKKKVNGNFTYNGIDRIDPERGYVTGNMRACCRFCNTAKLNRSEQEFENWIKKLIEWRCKSDDDAIKSAVASTDP